LASRIPRRQEIALVFLICIFPTHVWSIIAFLRELPSYLMRLNAWEIASVFAYSQTFVLLESLILTIVITILAIALPGFLIRDRFVPQAGIFVVLISFWTALIHYQGPITAILPLSGKYAPVAWLASLIIALVSLSILVRQSPKFEKKTTKLIESVAFLSAIYLIIDVVCLFLLLMRFISISIL
jgi:hypothetical protein